MWIILILIISKIIWRDAYTIAADNTTGNTYCLDEDNRYQANSGTVVGPATPGGGLDNISGNIWAVSLPLSTGDWFCVNSLGSSVEVPGKPTMSVVAC